MFKPRHICSCIHLTVASHINGVICLIVRSGLPKEEQYHLTFVYV